MAMRQMWKGAMKLIPIVALIPLLILALSPPWATHLDCTLNSLVWLYLVFISGFLMFLYFFFKVNISLKLFLLWCYIGCFLSKAPYLCFTLFWSVIACAYYYLLCKQITDFTPVKKSIQALFFFITLLIIMQLFGLDTLLNFNQKSPIILGTIGNYMILGSFICVLAPFLIQVSWLNWIPLIIIAFISKSSGTVLSIFAGLGIYLLLKNKSKKIPLLVITLCIAVMCIFAYKTHDFDEAVIKSGRFPVWKRTIKLANENPVGYGIATYRLIFPLKSQDLISSQGAGGAVWEYENTRGRGLAWRRAHNCFTQILFETGWYGFLTFMSFVGMIMWRVRKDPLKLAGLVIIGMNMLTAFPSRMTQSVLIILMYLAFCEYKERTNGKCRYL